MGASGLLSQQARHSEREREKGKQREKRMTAAAPGSVQGTSSILLVQENGYAHAEVGNVPSMENSTGSGM